LLAILLLGFAGTAKADTLSKVTVDGTAGSWDVVNGISYGIPPYGGTLNGVKESFYCVDFSSQIAPSYSWNVNITSLTGSDFSSMKLWKTLGAGVQTAYLEMTWLITQMISTKDNGMRAEYQWAIWSFTDNGLDPPWNKCHALKSCFGCCQQGLQGTGMGDSDSGARKRWAGVSSLCTRAG
jgi:hypothetical protein